MYGQITERSQRAPRVHALSVPIAAVHWIRSQTAIDVRCGVRHPRSTVTIDRTLVEGKVVLHVAGRMDAENAAYFEGQCNSCIAEGARNLVVDLGDRKSVV